MLLAFAKKDIYAKSMSTVDVSSYDEYFGQKIFAIGSKLYIWFAAGVPTILEQLPDCATGYTC